MEGFAVYGFLAALLAFFAAALGLSWILSGPREKASSFLHEEGVRTGFVASLLRHGIRLSQPVAQLLLRSKKFSSLLREAVRLFEERGYVSSLPALTSVLCVAALIAAVLVGVLTGSPIAALAVPSAALALCAVGLRGLKDSRQEAVREAVPDTLRSMGACFQVGYTLQQSFEQVALESPDSLRLAFQRAAHLLKTGRPASEALLVLRECADVPELSFVAVALQVQHEAGGSMRSVLDAARDTVEGELELKRSLKVHTAQARLSARIVSVMPLLLIALFSLVSEGFLEPFFASPTGWALLLLALGMQAAGIFAVRRMLAVEVSL